jgi:AraC-like DNA-binding protein
MNEAPGRGWTLPDLAAEAGMSASRFAETFPQVMGETPLAYLRRWRMTLARRDLARGERVQAVARRYGYASGEALSRAFRRAHGITPLDARQGAG